MCVLCDCVSRRPECPWIKFVFVLVVSDIEEPAFEPRDVIIRKDVWVTDEFEILDFLGRLVTMATVSTS